MSPEGRARNRAHRVLYGLTREQLARGTPEYKRARDEFEAGVLPTYHFIFDEVADELRDGTLTAQEAARRNPLRSFALSLGFVGVMAVVAFVASRFLITPAHDANATALEQWLRDVRAGRQHAPESAPNPASTESAVRAIAASRSHRVVRETGGYHAGGGVTCYDIRSIGPSGDTAIVVRVSSDPGPARVTHACLAPPCSCGPRGALLDYTLNLPPVPR